MISRTDSTGSGTLHPAGRPTKRPGADQIPLFGARAGAGMTVRVPKKQRAQTTQDPHLQAARRLARQIRRYPERSPEETRTGLAICRELKAYLAE